MRRVFSLLLICTLLFSLCACGKQENENLQSGSPDTQDSQLNNEDINNEFDAEPVKYNFGESKVGDYINFGSYEQDNNTDNGKETIEWLVLDKQGDRILVVSKYAIECWQYNYIQMAVTWETSAVRRALNTDFLNNAFTQDEQSYIPTVTVQAHENPYNNINQGNDTQDKIFLLSINEANEYFNSDEERICSATEYAVAKGAINNSISGNCLWWLRTIGENEELAVAVGTVGHIFENGCTIYLRNNGVRPAMWIEIK